MEDSWRDNLTGEIEEDEAADGENVDAIVKGAGVLGLIQQFQKANKDNRPRAAVGL
jgi:autophagy-related protein 9